MGFISSMDAMCTVVICVYAVTGIHRLWEDEQSDRLDLAFAANVSRTEWLCAATVSTAATCVITLFAVGCGTWIGAVITGVDITFVESIGAIANTAPLVVLFLGLAIAFHGTFPKWTVPIAAGGAGALYLLSFLGPALGLPDWVTDISPWRHIAVAPPDPVNWAGTIVMSALGLILGAIGLLTYARRDLQ
jgi:ABC-2 type transport system permease protein